MHVDQQFAKRAQRLHGNRLAVEISAAAAVGAHHAPQLAFAIVRDGLLVEPGERGCVRRQGESGADLGTFRSVTHRAAVGPAAHGEEQGVDQDGFAGARFTREHGEAAAELEFDGLHDGEVTDLQVRQHAMDRRFQAPGGWPSRVPRPQCSLDRRIR